jgi:hypothetical protein
MASADVMAITKWSISVPEKSPASNVLRSGWLPSVFDARQVVVTYRQDHYLRHYHSE